MQGKVKADNVKPWAILWFALYTWDFYSDILFVVRLAEYSVNKEEHAEIVWWLFAASTLFIVIPWTLNLIQLFRAQKKWTTDSTAGRCSWLVCWYVYISHCYCALFILLSESMDNNNYNTLINLTKIGPLYW